MRQYVSYRLGLIRFRLEQRRVLESHLRILMKDLEEKGKLEFHNLRLATDVLQRLEERCKVARTEYLTKTARSYSLAVPCNPGPQWKKGRSGTKYLTSEGVAAVTADIGYARRAYYSPRFTVTIVLLILLVVTGVPGFPDGLRVPWIVALVVAAVISSWWLRRA